jgi:hypothetical protein
MCCGKGDQNKFKNIDDPMVKPRLTATLDAHHLLWSIRLLLRRTLTPAQRELAKDLCELELVTDSGERDKKQQSLYTRIVESSLAAENRRIPASAAAYHQQVSELVEELLAPAHKGENFSTRLRSAVHRRFPEALKNS